MSGSPADPARQEQASAAPGGAADATALLTAVQPGDVGGELLPLLEVVFDRLERLLASSLRELVGPGVELIAEDLLARRFGDYLETVPEQALLGLFTAIEWDGGGLVTVDDRMIGLLVETLLGGGGLASSANRDRRARSGIECALAERLMRAVLRDLERALAPLAPVGLRLDRLESDPRHASITRAGDGCAVLRLGIERGGRRGAVDLVLPLATLEPARTALGSAAMGERLGHDTLWREHLASELRAASVMLEAVLEERSIGLGEVMAFRVGTLLPLGIRPDAPITLSCGGISLLTARMGRLGDHVAVRIEEPPARGGERERA